MPAFQDCSIYALVPDTIAGFSRKIFSNLVLQGGGNVASSPEEATHISVHHDEQPELHELGDVDAELCSLLWFFACLEAEEPLSPSTQHIYLPFPSARIPGALTFGEVTLTGFTNIDRTAARVLTEAAGLTYSGVMNYSLSGTKLPNQTELLLAKDLDLPAAKTDTAR